MAGKINKRKGKRNRKFLGSSSHGKGNAKNKRGKGCKGGWGRAGMHKHRFSYVTTYEREFMRHGGRFGFSNPTKREVKTINLYEIDNMAKKGEIKGKFEFIGKILGCGSLSSPLEISACSASKRAVERIEKTGGKFVLLKPEVQDKKLHEADKKESQHPL